MEGMAFKGDIKDVCAELKAEVAQNKGKTVADLLRERRKERIEKALQEQFGEPLPWVK